ncbi:MAG: LLM class F420-dependent oxidoreductase [Rhodospirillaceae bacterium]|nr:LLM class F420-dependent oxidoreductase [Rhodospirillaceae bacterium]|tara:strand:+ start:281 stop:1162 length:882 start_codon:yes stop_codon:yes gene_type:complete
MKFALHFGNITFPKPEDAKKLATLAESAGFESIIAVEHTVIPSNYSTKYPYNETGRLPGDIDTDWPDPLAWLTYIGAITQSIRLITGVLILPQRNPLILAKHLATIDCLTNGRLELGVGVGWLREEFDALGIPFKKRGERMDEYIQSMRKLWTENHASYSGNFVNFNQMNCSPKPKNSRIPIIIGGHSKIAVKRAAQLGDGFFPATGMQADLEPLLDMIKQEALKMGRDPKDIEIMTGCPEVLPGSGHDALHAVEYKKNLGVNRLALPVSAFLPDLETRLLTFGESVIKKFQR